MTKPHRQTSYNPRSLNPLRSIRAMLMLVSFAAAGLAGNYFGIPLFSGMDFLFSSIAILIVVRIYGIAWGMLVAIAATGYTYFLWNHPCNIIIFTSEALVVGWLLRRRSENLVVLDGVFWFLLGMPMVWLFYFGLMGLDNTTILLISLKFSVNGIFNALIADLILTYLPVRKWVEHCPADFRGKQVTLQQMLFNLLVAFVLFPALVFMVTDNRREQQEMEQEFKSHTAAVATQISNQLMFWQQQHLHAVTELAKIAAHLDMKPSPDLQRDTEHIKRAFPDFVAMYVGDTAGTSIAYYPLVDARGRSTVGVSFADREYYQEVKTTLQSGMSDVFVGRAGVPFATVVLTVPVLEDNRFRGYVTGGLDLSYIGQLLKLYTYDRELHATVLDRKGRIIASTNPDLAVMQVYNRKKGGEIQPLGANSYRWLPPAGKNMHMTVRWQKSIYVREDKIGGNIPWTLVIEIPYAPYFADVQDYNIKDLAGMLLLAVLAFLFASVVNRQLVTPLSSLALVTTNLPGKLLDQQNIDWPDSPVTELNSLVSNFKSMANILKHNFQELKRQSAAIKASRDGIAVLDQNGKYLYMNRAHAKIHGYHSPKELVGKLWKALYVEEELSRFEAEVMPKLWEAGHWRGEAVGKKQDGSLFPQEISLSAITGGGIVCVVRDITARKQAEQAIWEEKERAQVTLHSIGDAVITTDALGKVEYLNPVAEDLTGWTNAEAQGRPLPQVFNIVNEKTGAPVENPVGKCLKEGRIVGLANHTSLIHRAGYMFAIEDSASPIKDREGRTIGAVLVFHDVSDKRSMVQQLTHQAHYDFLTNLPNRVLFKDRLNLELSHAHRNKALLAVMFLDLDRFKLVNDTLGHAMGDQLLKGVAKRLSDCLRESDTVSRLGGDEFTILLPGLSYKEDAAKVAQKIINALQQPWLLGGHEFHITTSIGIALYPNDGEDADTLLKHADTAMYRAKEQGGNDYQLYTPAMNAIILERLDLENSLRHAVKNKEFVVFYQPQVNTNTGQITGMEALVRWQHPYRGLISPNEFIPVAEETGLIVPIGEWVLRTACAQIKAWQETGFPPMRVTVNLSARQFLQQKNLVAIVAQILQETGLDPRWLELEITESIAMQDVEFTITMLYELRRMGIQIAIDDFGTGYSSLNYLKRFPINTLKIDRSFVCDIGINQDNTAIVSTIINLGQNMGLNVIAEGVEAEEQLVFLKKRDCIEMQGYLFSKPVPAEEFERLLTVQKRFKTGSSNDYSI